MIKKNSWVKKKSLANAYMPYCPLACQGDVVTSRLHLHAFTVPSIPTGGRPHTHTSSSSLIQCLIPISSSSPAGFVSSFSNSLIHPSPDKWQDTRTSQPYLISPTFVHHVNTLLINLSPFLSVEIKKGV